MDKTKLLMATLTAHLRNYNEAHAEMLADYMVTLFENGKGDNIHTELMTFVGPQDAQAIMDWFHNEVHRLGLTSVEKSNSTGGEDARSIIQARQSRHQQEYQARSMGEEEEEVRPSRGLEGLTAEDMQPLRLKPVKCPYSPNCRAPPGTCPYYHPTENCHYFPNCQYGPACLYYHPPQPCRFQDKCKNPTCNYQHQPHHAAAHYSTLNKNNVGTACRYGSKCRNENCYFAHNNGQPCRFGGMCTNGGCPFKHPPERQVERQVRYSKINVQCRFGRQCAKADCPFVHEELNCSIKSNMQDNQYQQQLQQQQQENMIEQVNK